MALLLQRQESAALTFEELDYTKKHKIGLYLLVACCTFIIHDYFLTVYAEIKHVWRRSKPIHYTTILFAINRYFPIATVCTRCITFILQDQYSSLGCKYLGGITFSAWAGVICLAVVELVLLIRIWLLYQISRKVGIYLGLVFVAGTGAGFVVRSLNPQNGINLVKPINPTLLECPRAKPAEFFWLYFIALIAQILGAIPLVAKWWEVWKMRMRLPFINTIIKQGAVYYTAVWLALLFGLVSNMSTALYVPLSDAHIFVPISSVVCNRLVLSLQEEWSSAGARNRTQTETTSPKSLPVWSHYPNETVLIVSAGHLDFDVEPSSSSPSSTLSR